MIKTGDIFRLVDSVKKHHGIFRGWVFEKYEKQSGWDLEFQNIPDPVYVRVIGTSRYGRIITTLDGQWFRKCWDVDLVKITPLEVLAATAYD